MNERKTPEEIAAAADAWAEARLDLWFKGLTNGGMHLQADVDEAEGVEGKAAEALLAALGRSPIK